MSPFIVAEVSKNWGPEVEDEQLISRLFEGVIQTNLARGYRLHSFQINRLMVKPDQMNETIVAVFELAKSEF